MTHSIAWAFLRSGISRIVYHAPTLFFVCMMILALYIYQKERL